jgi:hypothetical protein
VITNKESELKKGEQGMKIQRGNEEQSGRQEAKNSKRKRK